MNIFVARQPIFDRSEKIYGYELLFRQGIENRYENIDGAWLLQSILDSYNDLIIGPWNAAAKCWWSE